MQSFIRIDAGEILIIRPSQTMPADVLAWAPERGGSYSVRSAYRILKEEQSRLLREKEGGVATLEAGKWWIALKKHKVPPKVRIFWWRVIRGFLPSNAELSRRHILKDDNCEACGNPSESLFHVMVDCP